jgi:hypothetical protein
MNFSNPFHILLALTGLLAGVIAGPAHAGVFNTPQFQPPGEWSLGLEPEFILTNGAGFGANLRFQQGLTELNTVNAIIGTGGGPRRFRFGGNLTFDFFPDVQGQPGIGLATQAIYYRVPGMGRLELTAIPYLHKTFATGGGDVDPFFAVPFGMVFSEGRYQAISTVAFGASFKNSEHIRYIAELGVAVNNMESYLSGGVVYTH